MSIKPPPSLDTYRGDSRNLLAAAVLTPESYSRWETSSVA
jgi:hypothetical protein